MGVKIKEPSVLKPDPIPWAPMASGDKGKDKAVFVDLNSVQLDYEKTCCGTPSLPNALKTEQGISSSSKRQFLSFFLRNLLALCSLCPSPFLCYRLA